MIRERRANRESIIKEDKKKIIREGSGEQKQVESIL